MSWGIGESGGMRESLMKLRKILERVDLERVEKSESDGLERELGNL